MRTSFAMPLLCLSAWLLVMPGCVALTPAPDEGAGDHTTATDGKLEVHVAVDRREVRIGEEIRLTVTARNTHRLKTIQIASPTAGDVIATVWRFDTSKRWQRWKQFPTAHLAVPHEWVLARGNERSFELVLPIEPDWPVLQTLKLSVELSGRPDLRPHVFLSVKPR